MRSYKDILLKPTSTIKEALEVIDSGAMRIALVVDDNNKLLGTLTDGDIRRGLLKNLSLKDSIETIIFKTPTVCSVEDSKEYILEVATAKKLYQMPIVDKDGILVDIKEVNELLKPTLKTNKVVLMVGGLGTRLRPLTEHTPKPMLKVGNRPILETIIMNFKKYGFTNIILSVSYKSEIIEEYFKDGSNFGVNIEYIHEEKRMGTAGALSLMRDKLNEPFFVMNGDLLTNINFEYLLNYHIKQEVIATMCLRGYEYQIPYGVVNVNEQGDICTIEEKPKYHYFVNGGIYLLNAEALTYIPDNEFFDMPYLFEILIKDDKICGSYIINDYWLDIGRIDEYKKANAEYKNVF